VNEFILIFAITTVVLCILSAALYFGRPPVYQVSREEALQLLEELVTGELTELKWLVFIGHAISADPDLNEIRLQCQQLELAAEQGNKMAFSAGAKRYNSAGIEQIKLLIVKLEKLIAITPVYREF